MYGIYKFGEPVFSPRFVSAKAITEYDVVDGVAIYLEYSDIFNAQHFVKDLLVDPDNILVFEV